MGEPTDEDYREHARKHRRTVPVVVVRGTDEADTAVDPESHRRLRSDVARLKRHDRVARWAAGLLAPLLITAATYAVRAAIQLADLRARIERVEQNQRTP